MTEPTRLLSGEATEFERLLLGAVAHEQPSRFQRRRMRRALALAELGFLATSAKAIAGFATHVMVVTVVATSLVGGGSSPIAAPAHPRRETSTAAQVRGVTKAPAARTSETESAAAPVDAVSTPSLATDQEPAERKPETRGKAFASQRRGAALRDEIALMDQARTELRSGAPARALSTLDQYRLQYPNGSFGQEATVLRIESLATSGNHSQAVIEANAFLARDPNSPHGDRLRRVIAGGTSRH
jgi:hypothetical protein